jgi:hypothetical protein
VNPVDAAIEDALLHHAAELVLLGNDPMDEKEEILFTVGFQQGVQWAMTGDWRLSDG